MSFTTKIKTLPSATEFKRLHLGAAESKPFFIFDFDGTLVNFHSDPLKVKLSEINRESLLQLSQKYPDSLLILSGRKFEDLEYFFKDIPVLLTGEHGARSNFMELVLDLKSLVPDRLNQYLNQIVQNYPGSFIEEKALSKVLHYRRCIPEIPDSLALEWNREINLILENSQLVSSPYSKVLEIKPKNCSKKNYVTELKKGLLPGSSLFVFGDDIPDQEIFDGWKSPELISIGVGDRIKRASYQLSSPAELEVWLRDFIAS